MVGRTSHSRSRRCLAHAFLVATYTYWLEVWPFLRGELHTWRSRAEAIPNVTLRHIALEALEGKRGNLEGAVAFAILSRREHRLGSVRAMAAYEAAFDYLDCLCEMPNADPIANCRQLSQALIVAVQPGSSHPDYYAHNTFRDDGGYLRALVDACQVSLGLLPAYRVVSDALVRVSTRIADYQSFNHGDVNGSHEAFVRWAISETIGYRRGGDRPELHWWEIGAAGGSSLAVFALIAAAADPLTRNLQVATIECAYFPWIGAANSLLDSLIDQDEDDVPGQHRLLDYYASTEEISDRLALITEQAMVRAHKLGRHHGHALIVAAMTSFYLSDLEGRGHELCEVRKRLRKSLGVLDTPTMLVMRARGIVAHRLD